MDSGLRSLGSRPRNDGVLISEADSSSPHERKRNAGAAFPDVATLIRATDYLNQLQAWHLPVHAYIRAETE